MTTQPRRGTHCVIVRATRVLPLRNRRYRYGRPTRDNARHTYCRPSCPAPIFVFYPYRAVTSNVTQPLRDYTLPRFTFAYPTLYIAVYYHTITCLMSYFWRSCRGCTDSAVGYGATTLQYRPLHYIPSVVGFCPWKCYSAHSHAFIVS